MTTSEADHDRESLMLSRLFARCDLTRAVIDAATAVVDWHRDTDPAEPWRHELLLDDLAAAVDDYRRRR